ncbi:hypothetical protein ABCR94_03900 [Streptomyces sp. 21So2-11]|uniref:hypothetical protein n=1 Tax=Streptomyces sp. 21So2-11 TaxID=3144408 RepID=UPI00321C3569
MTRHSLMQLLATAKAPAPDLERRLDRLLTHSSSDTGDDPCLIGIQVTCRIW